MVESTPGDQAGNRIVFDAAVVNLLTDPESAAYFKDEVVRVDFASQAGIVLSREGPNAYQPGDALITSENGDRWAVSRERFAQKYAAVPPTVDGNGHYRAQKVLVRAKQMTQAFSIARQPGGDVLLGDAGDWLLQYAPRDFGIVGQTRFAKVYRRAD
jgi:hypothetical protein